jgi:hypothetical protein
MPLNLYLMETAGEFAPATDTEPAAPAGRLFHFTGRAEWEAIQREGVIRAQPTAAVSVDDPEGRVVWLLDLDNPRASGRNDAFAQVRLTVPVHRDVRYWPALEPAVYLARTLNATPAGIPASWYRCPGDIPLDGVIAHHVAPDGTWPAPDPGGDGDDGNDDAFGPAPDHATVAAWSERCTAALGSPHLPADLAGDRLTAVLLRFNALPMLLDTLRHDPQGRRRRAAWRSAGDIALALGIDQ